MSLLLILNETPEDEIIELPWVCSVQDVADLLRSRLVGEFGREQPEFNDETFASAPQVEALIRKAAWLVAPKIGTEPPDEFLPGCRTIVALRAAMLVENSFQSDEVNQGRSPYERYKEQFDDELGALKEAIAEAGGGGGGESVATSTMPSGSFPPAPDEMDGLGGWERPRW